MNFQEKKVIACIHWNPYLHRPESTLEFPFVKLHTPVAMKVKNIFKAIIFGAVLPIPVVNVLLFTPD